MMIIGIDPGKSGGISIITNESVKVYKMPETEVDIFAILNLIKLHSCANGVKIKAYIEKVHAMPGNGVTSMFSFGQNYGFLRGCLVSLRIPFDEVSPQKWQKAIGCLSKGDKNALKQKAQQLFPDIKITLSTADSLLIAEYGRNINDRS